MSKKLKLTFCTGVNTVTGANYLLEDEEAGLKILVDCGLIQGERTANEDNNAPFSYDPKTIDVLFVTHAHLDHVGRIPRLIEAGFEGRIISTIATKDLARFMVEDEAHILAHNKHIDPELAKELIQIYSEKNIDKMMDLWEGVPYHQPFDLKGLKINFRNSGHILGSAFIEIICNGKKIVFTGDLGNSPSPILQDCEKLTDADYLIMESVYGDRNHEDRDTRKVMLEHIIQDNVKKRGTLVMPTFSLERTQELLYEISDLMVKGRIPNFPFYLDSPLAIKLTDVYKKHIDDLNTEASALAKTHKDIFSFPGLKIIGDAEESKNILRMPNPKIIIAGSGMSSGGRVVHHEHNYLPDPNNTILLTGYQSVGTLGRHIQDKENSVYINGEQVLVRAKVEMISGYSGHKDSDALLEFVNGTSETVKQIFTVMGEPSASMFLIQKIRDNLGLSVRQPEKGEIVFLEC
ncbi:MAG: MBL fold metallo-hydrolase [Candidatus Nomurabacteria bacterium]|nr:MBL fold metallo-hydrolase [Candidatus Nomurabacteria bacterium]